MDYILCSSEKDHPRLRGEQKWKQRKGPPREGSPPLARGTALLPPLAAASFRITPACAGNRSVLLIPVASARDHPRLRGEQSTSTDFSGHIRGSPPLARGTVKPMKNKSIERRITPACAGNSHLPCRNRSHRRDHPRLRGEQQSRDLSVPQGRGSPPLARGTAKNMKGG